MTQKNTGGRWAFEAVIRAASVSEFRRSQIRFGSLQFDVILRIRLLGRQSDTDDSSAANAEIPAFFDHLCRGLPIVSDDDNSIADLEPIAGPCFEHSRLPVSSTREFHKEVVRQK